MEIDLARAVRAVTHIGSALDEMRGTFRPGQAGVIRIRAEDKIVEVPIRFVAMGLVAALLIGGTQRHRKRTTEPGAFSWRHAKEHRSA